MSCAELEGAIVKRALDTLDGDDRPVLEAHLAACDACRERSSDANAFADDLGRVLRAAADRSIGRAPSRRAEPRPRNLVAALAAALCFSATLAWVLFPNRPGPGDPPADAGRPTRKAEDSLDTLVRQLVVGGDVERDLLGYGRKALPALRRHADNPRAQALIDRLESRKLKVLYVEHPPRYEHRFLKNALIRDPRILAHCFLTSADEGFPQEHTRSDDPLFQKPLARFPQDLKDLLQFDVILYGDVDPARLGAQETKNIETFVAEFGGGIVFISGLERNPKSLSGTPLANLLPVVPEEAKDSGEAFRYGLTEDGRRSPVTRFAEFLEDAEKNLEHWEDRDGLGDGLRGVRWFSPSRPKAGSSVLVEWVGAAGGRFPLFVARKAGRGRVFWSATDETWLWRYLTGDFPWFYPFWQGAIDWVAAGKG